jgi:hypothetical protein
VRLGRRGKWIAAVGLAAIVLVLGVGQLVLPGIAASRIKDKVARYGRVSSVSVSAFPAIQLLWESADSVQVKTARLDMTAAQAAALIAEAADTTDVDAHARAVNLDSLLLHHVRLRKRGSALFAEALVGGPAVNAAMPTGVHVALLTSINGRVRVRLTGGPLGREGSIQVRARAVDGQLLAEPLATARAGALPGLRQVLFSDPHIYVVGVGASVLTERPRVYRLTMSARLR